MLRFLFAGESHGKSLVGIIEGMPAGLTVNAEYINAQLRRRQKGYGRGQRMAIEKDTIEILSGVRNEKTLGSPISFLIKNRDYEKWQDIMNPGKCSQINARTVTRPRPGHADLAGSIKYRQSDMRNILERASARETAVRVAAGAFCKLLLGSFGISIYSQLVSAGDKSVTTANFTAKDYKEFMGVIDASDLHCFAEQDEAEIIALIDRIKNDGESLGGSFEVGAIGVPPGLGSHVSWDRKLDGKIAGLFMSIPAIKAVEIGEGIRGSTIPGSQVHDQLYFNEQKGVYRTTNIAGGIEGGISNGELISVRAYMKPIPTLNRPLRSVDTQLWREESAQIERADVFAVPAAAVIGEAMLALGISQAFLEKFGNDNLSQINEAYDSYRNYMKKVWKWEKR